MRGTRRELLAAGAGVGVALAIRGSAASARSTPATLEFASLGTGHGWPGWLCPGVANLRREGGLGVLEAGSDVFPCDPRPVAFALDRRFRDGEIDAMVRAAGAGAGVVLRRTGPRDYYAAIYDSEAGALIILRRSPGGATELARLPAPPPKSGPMRLSFSTKGIRPTALTASLDIGTGLPLTITATDAAPALQRAGDPGVLATARTLFPSQGPPVLPALGNLHLLPYGVQEGEAFIASPAGQELVGEIRERSTASFERIELRPQGAPQVTRPSVIAATAAPRRQGGAVLHVASDVPAHVDLEISTHADFRHSRVIHAGRTDRFDSAVAELNGKPRERVYWRARARRKGREAIGPVRSFRPLPLAGSTAQATVAIGACAAQFGPIFDHLAAARPDAFVWQGDLNYPDTIGPLAQTVDGYAGIWRDFLANPRMAPLLEHSLFGVQRDDHDYGVQDANSTILVPWGLHPWESLMEQRPYYRFSAGLAEFWVLDERRHKSNPKLPDNTAKTLLGARQRKWLLHTLAASDAPFKVVCSPCTIAPVSGNSRDGSWATGFTAERDLLLAHVKKHVRGHTLFVTGDTHWTMVYDRGGLFEARPCPLGIPTPNDITVTDPNVAEDARGKPGVAYADDNSAHVALIHVSGRRGRARLDLTLLREDGAKPFTRRFENR